MITVKLQVLLSTMNQNDYSILEKTYLDSDAVVINQCTYNEMQIFSFRNNKITWVNTTNTGLSSSRNMAIDNANGDICLIADDDLEYFKDYKKIIINQFNENPKVDVIAFQVEGIEKQFKNYASKAYNVNYLNMMKISSVEIAFKLQSIKNAGIIFDELFGSGSVFSMGEENIFLLECIKKGLKIKYVPIKIARLHIGDSSWFKGFNEKYFIDRGAIFTAMSIRWSYLYIIQFALRKYNIYSNETTFIQAITNMLKGRKKFLIQST